MTIAEAQLSFQETKTGSGGCYTIRRWRIPSLKADETMVLAVAAPDVGCIKAIRGDCGGNNSDIEFYDHCHGTFESDYIFKLNATGKFGFEGGGVSPNEYTIHYTSKDFEPQGKLYIKVANLSGDRKSVV